MAISPIMTGRTRDELIDEGQRIAAILRAMFGPDRWVARAAKSLGISERMVRGISRGEWAMPRRRWAMLQNIAERRPDALRQAGRAAAARVLAEYEERARVAVSAQMQIRALDIYMRRQRREPLP